jgi:hypothetical protein
MPSCCVNSLQPGDADRNADSFFHFSSTANYCAHKDPARIGFSTNTPNSDGRLGQYTYAYDNTQATDTNYGSNTDH